MATVTAKGRRSPIPIFVPIPDDELPPPSTRNPDPTPTIPVPATLRPAPGMGSTGPPWWCLGSWRRHWRTARRRTTRRGTAGSWWHGLPMSDNGKCDDCKRRQDFSSMYHGILLITLLAQDRAARGGDSASREGARSGSKNALRDFSIHYMFIRYRRLISDEFQPRGCRGQDRLSGPLHHLPDGRGRSVTTDVRRHLDADHPTAGAARVRCVARGIRCGERRKERHASVLKQRDAALRFRQPTGPAAFCLR